ncbi:uncharacterized protein LOC126898318 [Daktulosphaira vitifoliae]|uniref:uncharacterized protein LOC126898318 n=1 Tax=Daktulosphaira vitifoliae TaxID=58002 RepID=UPI0021A9DF02|nr:uncharacterized protein LOC126898318 [Daktulosphaira vitifoliae]
MGLIQLLIVYIFLLPFLICNSMKDNVFTNLNHTAQLVARFSQHQIHGIVIFSQHSSIEDIILISISLSNLEESSNWSWEIRELPVDYTILYDRCSDTNLGNKILDFDNSFGKLTIENNTKIQFSISKSILNLIGQQGIWHRSLLLKNNGKTICSTITTVEDSELKVAQAKFLNRFFGSIYIIWVGMSESLMDAIIYVNLEDRKSLKREVTYHNWKIFSTDILETHSDKSRHNCDALQIVYDPDSNGLGDLGNRIGSLNIGKKSLFRDPKLSTFDIEYESRALYIVIFDSDRSDDVLDCAQINLKKSITLKGLINETDVKVELILWQKSPFEATNVKNNIETNQTTVTFRLHEMPPLPKMYKMSLEQNIDCLGIGNIFNPSNKVFPGPIDKKTQDNYAIGDLSNKYNFENYSWDLFLPLYGTNSIIHRSLVIYKNNTIWTCNTLLPFSGPKSQIKVPFLTAEVVFRYPLVGKILFRQPLDIGATETIVIIEGLVHADGTTLVNTNQHRWSINSQAPDKDFYSWKDRCKSSGTIYDPHKVVKNNMTSQCSKFLKYCSVGDISSRLDNLAIAGNKKLSSIGRQMFVDEYLSLFGLHSIIGKSLVIYDDHGPRARGDRLACSKIEKVWHRKAVVKDWYSNFEKNSITGNIELFQLSEYDPVDFEINLQGLQGAYNYYVYSNPVDGGLDLPCESSNLHEVWDPWDSKFFNHLRYGDWSTRFGSIQGERTISLIGNDSHTQLFGQLVFLGRSVVIHGIPPKKRLMCSSIERGYSPIEAREIRAMASFHNPNGFLRGYIRMTQLIYNDGSKSDTVIEVNLHYPGPYNRNMTKGHKWSIYVNPVGIDATVKDLGTRCTAAGYIWNPYYTQLADPLNNKLYEEECGPDQPLRCYVGDISGRLGTIDIGSYSMVFSDPNLPLEGDISAIGRSIVIFSKNGYEKLACANIEYDKDIIKYVNIRRTTKFETSNFFESVRNVMGVPDWMLTVDSRKTKILHNGACIQYLVHFKGAIANELEFDFSKLLSTGQLQSQSLKIPGYYPINNKLKIPYQSCPVYNKKQASNTSSAKKIIRKEIYAFLIFIIMFLNIQ